MNELEFIWAKVEGKLKVEMLRGKKGRLALRKSPLSIILSCQRYIGYALKLVLLDSNEITVIPELLGM